jgi:hypothetical protein
MGADQGVPEHGLQTYPGGGKTRPHDKRHDDPGKPDTENHIGGHFIRRREPRKQAENII